MNSESSHVASALLAGSLWRCRPDRSLGGCEHPPMITAARLSAALAIDQMVRILVTDATLQAANALPDRDRRPLDGRPAARRDYFQNVHVLSDLTADEFARVMVDHLLGRAARAGAPIATPDYRRTPFTPRSSRGACCR